MAARVDGIEITVAELNEEARARGLAFDSNPGLRNALVQEMVDRKLLVIEAETRKLDQTPRYILAERRMREILLAQQLLADDETTELAPDRLRAFIAANPHAFAQRVTARADLLSLADPLSASMRNRLASATNLVAAEEMLRSAGIPFGRGQESWDSADPASPLWSGRVAASEGALVLLPRGEGTIVAVLSGVTPQPVPVEQQAAVASALVSRISAEQRMRQILERSRASSTIRYQPGFGPGADNPTVAGAPTGQR